MSDTWHHDRKRYHPWLNPRANHKLMLRFLARPENRDWRTCFYYIDYAHAGPSWWRNLEMERTKRRETRRLEQACHVDLEQLWPLPRKPVIYYW